MKGKLTIYLENDNTLLFRLEDESSEIEFLDIKISTEMFMRTLTRFANQDCEFELRCLEYVGKQRERKREIVTVAGGRYDPITPEMKLDAIRPFCVDGWWCQHSDLIGNHHYQKGERSWELTFTRFVDKESEVGK